MTDRDGAIEMFSHSYYPLTRLEKLLFDGAYAGEGFANKIKELVGAEVEIVKRSELHKFVVIPKRWIVERSFVWLDKYRLLWKNCECFLVSTLNFVKLAFISIILKSFWFFGNFYSKQVLNILLNSNINIIYKNISLVINMRYKLYSIFILSFIIIFTLNSCKNHDKDSRIINLCGYEGFFYNKLDDKVNEYELEEAINNDLKSYAFLEQITDRDIIKKDDFIYVKYKGYVDDELTIDIKNDLLKVGAGFYNLEFENHLINKKINEEIIMDLKIPEDYKDKIIAGKNIQYRVYVRSINKFIIPELNNAFVKEYFDYNTVEEYYDYKKTSILEDKKYWNTIKETNEIIQQIIENSEFYINKLELEKTSAENLEIFKNIANAYNIPLEEYIEKILEITEDEFYENNEEKSIFEIQKKLIIEKIIKLENISINKKETLMIAENKYNFTKEMLNNSQQLKDLGEKLLEEKVFDILLEKNNFY